MDTILTKSRRQEQPSSSKTMKAAVITSPQTIELQEISIPQPKEGQVLVKIEGCGVCASSIPIWEGREWFNYPIAAGNPGHEGWGIVQQLGQGVTNVEVGDRVCFLSNNAFAEYDLANAKEVVVLPTSFDGLPFPGEALGCAMNIFKRSDIKAGQTVAIVGAGFLGLLLIQLAKSTGAKVIAISQRDFSLESAINAGADKTVKMDDHYAIIDAVKIFTNDQLCERVIEATGKEWPLNLAIELTTERGKLIVAGFHQDGMRQVNMQMLNWRGIDMINAHERDPKQYVQGMRDAVNAVEKGRLNPFPLFTHTFSLKNTDQALNMLRERPEGFIKAVVINDN